MSEPEDTQDPTQTMGLMDHLIELRDRLLRIVLAILIIFLSLFYWANDIYTLLAEPLTRHLPEGASMIAIDVASPFLTPFKLVLVLSVFLGMPFILYQIWAFIAPGLYKHEKKLALPLLVSSIFLFYAGVLFAYFVVFPLVFGFFTSVGPDIVNISTDIGRYLDFVISLFFGFGLAFEVPVATIILVAMGVTTPDRLARMRPYIIVAAFVIGMLLTPPDVISQVLLAVPMWLLFEVGVIASRFLLADKLRERAEEEARMAAEEAEEKRQAAAAASAPAASGMPLGDDDLEVVDDPADANESGHQEYEPLSEEEMDAELDRIEAEEEDEDDLGGEDEDDDDYVDDGKPPKPEDLGP